MIMPYFTGPELPLNLFKAKVVNTLSVIKTCKKIYYKSLLATTLEEQWLSNHLGQVIFC